MNRLKVDKGKCNCIIRYYDDNSNSECKKCYYACELCLEFGKYRCEKCDASKKRRLDRTECICMDKYYDD